MKHIFQLNGEDKLELSAEDDREQMLFNLVFPQEGEYMVEINGKSIIIKRKPKNNN